MLDGQPHLVGEGHRLGRCARVTDDGELVTTEAGDTARLVAEPDQAVGNGAQQAVAGLVAECLVDVLEAAQIDHQHGAGAPVDAGASDGVVQLHAEGAPVGQASESVLQRLLLCFDGLVVERLGELVVLHRYGGVVGERGEHGQVVVGEARPGAEPAASAQRADNLAAHRDRCDDGVDARRRRVDARRRTGGDDGGDGLVGMPLLDVIERYDVAVLVDRDPQTEAVWTSRDEQDVGALGS